jgi:uncharacterized protein (DUF58 family)
MNVITPTGRGVAISGIVFLVAGWRLEYPELVALGICCVFAIAFAALWMLLRPRVHAHRTIQPARVQEGEGAQGRLTVTNIGKRRSPPIVAVETLGDASVSVQLSSLAPGASQTTSYSLPTNHRGRYSVGPLRIGHTDPLRLMRVGENFAAQSTLIVHPRVHSVPAIPTGRARDADGPTTSTAPQGGIAFHSLREYVPGDDLRLIHWKSTARTGNLMVRHNVVTNEPRLMVVLDTSAGNYEDDESFEDAVRVAASLCVAACNDRYPLVFGTTGGERAVSDRRGSGKLAVLDTLAGVERSDNDPGLRELIRMIPDEHGVSLGVVTGQTSPQELANVSVVRTRFDMVSVISVGEKFGRPATAVRGALAVNVADSDEFAKTWASKVRR